MKILKACLKNYKIQEGDDDIEKDNILKAEGDEAIVQLFQIFASSKGETHLILSTDDSKEIDIFLFHEKLFLSIF